MIKKKVLVYHVKEADIYKNLLQENVPEADLLICHNREEVEKYGPKAEIAFVPYTFPQDLFKKMQNLEWVQVMAAGLENFVRNAEQFKNINLSRTVGTDAKYMAEYVLGYILYLSQKIDRVLKAQEEKRWDPFLMEFIHKKTCGVMGLGAIGTVVAKKAKDMGMRVSSLDMVKKDSQFIDKQYRVEEIYDFLKEADYLVLTLPVTNATVDLINKDVFRAMKKESYLINICRGDVVDEKALVEALKGGEIAGAVVDVVKQEPLPPDSELWECPNLIITPHISGVGFPEDMVDFFKENFQRYIKEEPLIGVVDFQRGF